MYTMQKIKNHKGSHIKRKKRTRLDVLKISKICRIFLDLISISCLLMTFNLQKPLTDNSFLYVLSVHRFNFSCSNVHEKSNSFFAHLQFFCYLPVHSASTHFSIFEHFLRSPIVFTDLSSLLKWPFFTIVYESAEF